MNKDEMFNALVENAIDFLKKSDKDLKSNGKYSVINFYTAVELILKARLLREHWSLIVARDLDFDKFVSGDSATITFEESTKRLDKALKLPVSKQAIDAFDSVRKHRNRIVHFYQTVSVEDIAKEQLIAWYHLQKILASQWGDCFSKWSKEFKSIDKKLLKHNAYLDTKYNDVKPEIDKKIAAGIEVVNCPVCLKRSAVLETEIKELKNLTCMVCDHMEEVLKVNCPNCNTLGLLHSNTPFSCHSCGRTSNFNEFLAQIGASIRTCKDDMHIKPVCHWCGNIDSIRKYDDRYLCISCFKDSIDLYECEHCGNFGNYEFPENNKNGCDNCDGEYAYDPNENS